MNLSSNLDHEYRLNHKFPMQVKQLFTRLFYRVVLFKSSAQINRMVQQQQQQSQVNQHKGGGGAASHAGYTGCGPASAGGHQHPHTKLAHQTTTSTYHTNTSSGRAARPLPPTSRLYEQRRRQSSVGTTNTTVTTATSKLSAGSRHDSIGTAPHLVDQPRLSIGSWRYRRHAHSPPPLPPSLSRQLTFVSDENDAGAKPRLVDSIRVTAKRFNSLSSADSIARSDDIVNLKS